MFVLAINAEGFFKLLFLVFHLLLLSPFFCEGSRKTFDTVVV